MEKGISSDFFKLSETEMNSINGGAVEIIGGALATIFVAGSIKGCTDEAEKDR